MADIIRELRDMTELDKGAQWVMTYSMQCLGATRSRLFSVITPRLCEHEPQRVSMFLIRRLGMGTQYLKKTG